MFKILGTDDAVNTCDCCGKSNLKSTVIVDVDGEVLHYGSVCATRHTKLTAREIKTAIQSEQDGRVMAAQKEFKASAEHIAHAAAINRAHALKIRPGVVFMDYCRAEYDAASGKARQIAARYNVEVFRVWV